MEQKKAYSAAEVAALLGVTKPRVYALCRQNGFPAVRVSPRRIIVPAAALDVWLEKQAAQQDA